MCYFSNTKSQHTLTLEYHRNWVSSHGGTRYRYLPGFKVEINEVPATIKHFLQRPVSRALFEAQTDSLSLGVLFLLLVYSSRNSSTLYWVYFIWWVNLFCPSDELQSCGIRCRTELVRPTLPCGFSRETRLASRENPCASKAEVTCKRAAPVHIFPVRTRSGPLPPGKRNAKWNRVFSKTFRTKAIIPRWLWYSSIPPSYTSLLRGGRYLPVTKVSLTIFFFETLHEEGAKW